MRKPIIAVTATLLASGAVLAAETSRDAADAPRASKLAPAKAKAGGVQQPNGMAKPQDDKGAMPRPTMETGKAPRGNRPSQPGSTGVKPQDDKGM